jgi:hypothetical protein
VARQAQPRAERLRSETHNVVQTIYVREVKLVDGKPGNMVIGTLGTIKDRRLGLGAW